MPPNQRTPSDVMLYRSVSVRREESDNDSRSFPVVLATETPVPVYDFQRGEVVNEVLELSGMDVPHQVPLVDSHESNSVVRVFGSIRELSVKNGELVGRAYFASDATSSEVYRKYAEGHLTDFSVGARTLGVEYEGNTKRVTRSRLIEGSAVVVGADSNAKAEMALRAYREPQQVRKEVMNEKLKQLLVERGLAEDATDADVLEFVEQELQRSENPLSPGVALDIVRQLKVQQQPLENGDSKEPAPKEDDALERALSAHGLSVADVAAAVTRSKVEAKKGVAVGPDSKIESGASEADKFIAAARYGIMQRSLGSVANLPEDVKRDIGEKPAGADSFRYKRLPDIAREFCERSGERVDGLPQAEIVKRALRLPGVVQRSQAFHTTGSFANLLIDAMNKRLRAAYDEAPASYQRWVRQAESASDFKALYRIVFGEIGMPSNVPENTNYPEMTASDSKESYRVEKHGGIFSISMEAVVNDDLDAIMRVPRMQGNAMRRKINYDAYKTLTDNNTLADGVALFHATSHGANLDANALAESALDTGFSVMMKQAGLDSTAILNITPRFLIVPAALSATAYRLTGGGIVPEAVGNVPLYGTNGPRPLEVVADAQLDSLGSATNWWLAADNNVVDTVEITFLQGEESPVLEREDGFENDTVKYKIRQTYGIKPIDFRGLYQGNS